MPIKYRIKQLSDIKSSSNLPFIKGTKGTDLADNGLYPKGLDTIEINNTDYIIKTDNGGNSFGIDIDTDKVIEIHKGTFRNGPYVYLSDYQANSENYVFSYNDSIDRQVFGQVFGSPIDYPAPLSTNASNKKENVYAYTSYSEDYGSLYFFTDTFNEIIYATTKEYAGKPAPIIDHISKTYSGSIDEDFPE